MSASGAGVAETGAAGIGELVMAIGDLAPREAYMRGSTVLDDPADLLPIVQQVNRWLTADLTWDRLSALGFLSREWAVEPDRDSDSAGRRPPRWLDDAARRLRNHADNRLHRDAIKRDLSGELAGRAERNGKLYQQRDRYRFMADMLDTIRWQARCASGAVLGVARVRLGAADAVRLRFAKPLPKDTRNDKRYGSDVLGQAV